MHALETQNINTRNLASAYITDKRCPPDDVYCYNMPNGDDITNILSRSTGPTLETTFGNCYNTHDPSLEGFCNLLSCGTGVAVIEETGQRIVPSFECCKCGGGYWISAHCWDDVTQSREKFDCEWYEQDPSRFAENWNAQQMCCAAEAGGSYTPTFPMDEYLVGTWAEQVSLSHDASHVWSVNGHDEIFWIQNYKSGTSWWKKIEGALVHVAVSGDVNTCME